MSPLKAVRLLRPWGGKEPGDWVLLHDTMARRLIEEGTAEEVSAHEKAPARSPVDKMVRHAPKAKGAA